MKHFVVAEKKAEQQRTDNSTSVKDSGTSGLPVLPVINQL